MSLAKKKIPSKDSSFTLLVNNAPVKGKYGIASILVHKRVNKISVAQVIIVDGDASKQDFAASSSSDFKPGTKVTVKLGNANDLEDPGDKKVFEGLVIRHGIKTNANQPSMLVLELRDEAVKMTIARKNKYFIKKSDSDIIEEIIGKYSLKKDVEATTLKHDEMIQYYSTDWDFILSRADVNGKLVYVEDGKLTIKKPNIKPVADLAVVYGLNMYEFEAEIDARDQYKSVKSTAWDPTKQDYSKGEGTIKGLVEEGGMSGSELANILNIDLPLQHTGKKTVTELNDWASAKLTRSKLAKVRGRVKVNGYSKIKPGDTISIEKFSDQFNGNMFVSEVRHELTAKSSWYTDIQFGLSQEWFSHKYHDVVDATAAGLIPGVHGLQIGVVTKIDGDPDSLDRVKIRIPIIDKNNEGTWARIAVLDAGKSDKEKEGRGSFFRPEVDDEVIVGFLNDDPRDPIILGMVSNSKTPAPLKAEKANDKKGFFTRSKMKLLFDDKDRSITIEVPDKNSEDKKHSIVLDEKKKSITITDQNKNKIELSDKGISITSAKSKDIKITADKGNIELKGLAIKLTADTEITAKSNGTAELSANTTTTIKGSASVMIN